MAGTPNPRIQIHSLLPPGLPSGRKASLPAKLHSYYRFTTFEEAQANLLGSVWKSRSLEDDWRYIFQPRAAARGRSPP